VKNDYDFVSLVLFNNNFYLKSMITFQYLKSNYQGELSYSFIKLYNHWIYYCLYINN